MSEGVPRLIFLTEMFCSFGVLSDPMAAAAAGPSSALVRIVAQRVTKAALLVDNVSRFVSIGDGVVLHVALLAGVDEAAIDAAVKQVLQSRVFILPPIGATPEQRAAVTSTDGTAATRPKPVAIAESDCDVLVVPQATLAGKVKGKVMQYHGQASKDVAQTLYELFCRQLRGALLPPAEFALPRDANGCCVTTTERDAAAADAAEGRASLTRRVLNGTYGNRQALELSSPGPFTHLFEV